MLGFKNLIGIANFLICVFDLMLKKKFYTSRLQTRVDAGALKQMMWSPNKELANSCGQGITSSMNSKTGVSGSDLAKKPLEQTKTRLLKGRSYCILHPRRPRGYQTGRRDIFCGKFTSRAEKPLGTSSRSSIPLIGQKNIFLPNQQGHLVR